MHFPNSLYVDYAALTERVPILEAIPDRARNLDLAGQAVRLHAAGDRDRHSPQIVVELLLADHAGHHRTGGDPDSHLDLDVPLAGSHSVADGERGVGDQVGVVLDRQRHPGHGHIAVPARPDLLDTMLLGDPVELGEQPVQEAHQPARVEARAQVREVDQVDEHDRRFRERVRDRSVLGLETLGDRLREDVHQDALAPRPLVFGLPVREPFPPRERSIE